MIDIPEYIWHNVDSPWISLELDTWDGFTRGRAAAKYPARSTVFWQGKEFTCLYIVKKGKVRISVYNQDGQEQQLYIACKGAIIGEIACILGKHHVTTAKTLQATELYVVPSKEAQRLFHSDPILADRLLQYEARKNRMMIAQQTMLSFDRATQRIAKVLLNLCDAYGRVRPEGIYITLRFTCTDIATMVSTSRVTVNNTLLELANAGVIEKQEGYYLIRDEARLQEMATAPQE